MQYIPRPWGLSRCLYLALYLFANTACGATSGNGLNPAEQAWLAAHPVLVVGTTRAGWPPFEGAGGRPGAGYSLDTLRAITKGLKVDLRVRVFDDWSDELGAACAGKIDIIMSVTPTLGRAQCLAFTGRYARLDTVIVAPRASQRFATDQSLNGKRIAGERDFEPLDEIRKRYPTASIIEVSDTAAALQLVARQEADAYVGALSVVQPLLASDALSGLAVVRHIELASDSLHFGVPRDRLPLATLLDRRLAQLPDAQQAALRKQWLATATQPDEGNDAFNLSSAEQHYLRSLPILRVGVDANWAPFNFRDANGHLAGMASDYLAYLARRLGIRFEPVFADNYPELLQLARDNKVDLIASAVPSDTRDPLLEYTSLIDSYPLVIVVRQDGTLLSRLSDLAGRRVAVSAGHVAVMALAGAEPNTTVVSAATPLAALQMVAEHRADAFVGNLASADLAIRQRFPGVLMVSGSANLIQSVGLGIKPPYAALVPLVNRALGAMPEPARLDIRAKWLATNYNYGTSWAAMLRRLAPIALAIAVALAFLWRAYRRLQREIVRREQVERALENQLGFERVLMETVPYPLVAKDAQNRYSAANAAYEKAVDMPASALLGKTPRESGAYRVDGVQRMDELARDVMATGRAARGEVEAVAADGRPRTYLYWIQPFNAPAPAEQRDARPAPPDPDMPRHAHGVVSTYVDITTEREQAAALASARDAAEAGSLAKDRFLAMMSHEIRTPMNGVLGLLELARRTTSADDRQHLLGMTQEAAGALLQILDDILDYSKIEAGRLSLEQAPCNLRDICDRAFWLLAGDAHAKGLTLRAVIDAKVAARILGDSVRLRQILVNLLSNAIKFTQQGCILLRVEADPIVENRDPPTQALTLSVSDTGIGVAPELHAMLFEPFTQAESSTTRHFGGTGLGLTICRQLAASMGGTLELTSEPGHGTTVTLRVTLPVVRAAHIPAAGPIRRATVIAVDPLVALGIREQLAALQITDDATANTAMVFSDGSDSGGQSDERTSGDGTRRNQVTATGHTRIMLVETPLPAGYRASDDGLALSVNPLSWHALNTVWRIAQGIPATHSGPSGAATAAADRRDRRPFRILVAEDHAVNRDLLKYQFELLGYACDIVPDGLAATAALARTSYALLLTDCHMPNLNGYLLATRIRAREAAHGGARLPIIGITASTLHDEKQRCLDAGMDDCMIKPISLTQLAAGVARWLPGEAPAQGGAPSGDWQQHELLRGLVATYGPQPKLITAFAATFAETVRADLVLLQALSHTANQADLRQWLHRQAGAFALLGYAPLTERLEAFAELAKTLAPAQLPDAAAQFAAHVEDTITRLSRAAAHATPGQP